MIIKDKTQFNECVYTICIVTPPTIEIHQTLYIVDSFYHKDNFTAVYNQLKFINIYVKDANGFTPLDEQYVFEVDTTIEKVVSFAYKIESYGDYYYDIETKITVISMANNNLFNYVFPCNLIDNNQFSIRLALLDKTNLIDQDLIRLSVYNANDQTQISFSKDTTTYQFTSTSIPHNNTYSYELFYSDDIIPFYNSTFNLTNFDRNRVTYNLAVSPFVVDFTEITCDLSITQMTIDSLPLSCSYVSTVLSCSLSNPSYISSLLEQSYDVYNTTYLFHQINLISCVSPKNKIDAVKGICLSSCKAQNSVDYNNECISECPSGTGNINGFCLDDLIVFSENSDSIHIEGDLSKLKELMMNNIDAFLNYSKTISSSEYSIQLFETTSPIDDVNCSSIDTSEIEKVLQSTEPLLIFKVDTYVEDAVTNEVEFSVMKRNGVAIPKDKYKDAKVEISYPINQNILGLVEAEKFSNEGIDIFNASDKFFNDLCFAYSTENNTDVIIKDRRKDFFKNVSFCSDGCEYEGIDYKTKKVKCNCEIYLPDEEIPPSNDINDFTEDIFSSNIAIVKCYKSLSKINASNHLI